MAIVTDGNGDDFEVVVQPAWREVQIIGEDGRAVIELTRSSITSLIEYLIEAAQALDELEAGE